jgi:hypothetical protein
MDASQDLVDLALTKLGTTNYQARVTRIVAGFSNPIDATIIDNKIYVIEYSGNQGVWEITFPAAPVNIVIGQETWLSNGEFSFNFETIPGRNYRILSSTNLTQWSQAGSVTATNSSTQFVDQTAGSSAYRFYRVVSP